MPVDSVWQPAKKRSAAAKKTGFARKIHIFQDRHLLSSATRAIAFLFASTCDVRNLRPDAGIGSLRCWSWRAGQDFGARSPALGPFQSCVTKSIGTTIWFISSSTNPPSPFARSAGSFASSRSIRISSAQFRRSCGQKQKRSRWMYKHNSKCSPDFLTRSEDRLFGLFSI